jgi:hypothetical protein
LIFTQEVDSSSSSSSTPFSGGSSSSSSAAARSLRVHGVQALNDSTVWAAEMTYPLTPAAGKGERELGLRVTFI